jgi:hypothetical protein
MMRGQENFFSKQEIRIIRRIVGYCHFFRIFRQETISTFVQ